MEQSLDQFFLKIPEPQQSPFCFFDSFYRRNSFTRNLKFNTPFYYFKGNVLYIFTVSKRKLRNLYWFCEGLFGLNTPFYLGEGRKTNQGIELIQKLI